MTSNYYDVVVLGMELGPLTAGALLARRGFRVLVLGQGGASDEYSCLGFDFTHRPFLLTSAHSPVFRRVFDELSLGQLFAQVAEIPSPCFQVILPDARIDVHEDHEKTEREIIRELNVPKDKVQEALKELGRTSGEIDKLFGADVVVPPESFFERREFSRSQVQNPFHLAKDAGPFARQGTEKALQRFLEPVVRMETAGALSPAPLVSHRQMGAWLFGCMQIAGGRDGLRRLLCDRIIGHGGDVGPGQSVTEIIISRSKVIGVRMRGKEEPTGCRTVLSDLSPKELAPLVAPNLWSKRFAALVANAPEPVLGYGLNLGVDPKVVPSGLAKTAFVCFGDNLGADLLRVEIVEQHDKTKAAIHVSCIVPRGEEESIGTGALRDDILDRMRRLVPFLDNHLRMVHSPYDGFGPLDLTGEADGETPPVPHPEEVPLWLLRRPSAGGALGVEGLPHRTGMKGLLLSGSQVVCGLSTEGEFIAGWGAAHIAGKIDPSRRRLVMSMRSKVEM